MKTTPDNVVNIPKMANAGAIGEEVLDNMKNGKENSSLDEGQTCVNEEPEAVEPAPEAVTIMAAKIATKYHGHLSEANIRYLFRNKKWNEEYGTVKLVSAVDRVDSPFDFKIIINAETFKNADEKTQEAILDHLLCYCGVRDNDINGSKSWRKNKPDNYFSKQVERRGLWSKELKRLDQAMKQMNLFENAEAVNH